MLWQHRSSSTFSIWSVRNYAALCGAWLNLSNYKAYNTVSFCHKTLIENLVSCWETRIKKSMEVFSLHIIALLTLFPIVANCELQRPEGNTATMIGHETVFNIRKEALNKTQVAGPIWKCQKHRKAITQSVYIEQTLPPIVFCSPGRVSLAQFYVSFSACDIIIHFSPKNVPKLELFFFWFPNDKFQLNVDKWYLCAGNSQKKKKKIACSEYTYHTICHIYCASKPQNIYLYIHSAYLHNYSFPFLCLYFNWNVSGWWAQPTIKCFHPENIHKQ